jgi:hypothetical protein
MRFALTGILALSLAAPAFAEDPPAPVAVYVTTPAEAQGFSDPSKERQDSVKDLKKMLGKPKLTKRQLTLVESPEQATIVLELLDREQQFKRTTAGVLFGTPWGHQRKRAVTVRVKVGEFSSELTSEKSSYTDAAADVVVQLQKWVAANRAKLMAAR